MDNKDFYLYIDGKPVKVSEEVYREYRHSEDKEKYFMKKLKKGKLVVDIENEEVKHIPSREVSYEEYIESHNKIKLLETSMEDEMNRFDTHQKLQDALDELSEEEKVLVEMLFYLGKTQREAAKALNVSQNTINYRKNKILEKLRIKLEKN